MSFEKSVEALAESNLRLADAMNKYADVIDKYALKIEAVGGDVAKAAAAETSSGKKGGDDKPTPAKGGRGKKAAAEPPADAGGDDDGFGGADDFDSGVPDKLTGDQVKAKLLEVRDAYGDKAPALKIINALGYNAIPDVKPADYAKVWTECEKAIKAAP